MMLMINTDCPISSVSKAVDILIESMKSNPVPDYIKLLGFYSYWGGQGIVSHVVYDIEDGKVDEGLKGITGRLLEYSTIDGYKIEVKVVTPIEQSLAFFSKEMPAV